MKKIFLNLATGVIPFAILISTAHAQQPKDAIQKDTLIYAKNEKNTRGGKDANSSVTANIAANDADNANIISKKALKRFKTEVKDAEAVKWFKLSNGFVAYYTEAGLKSRAYYDRNGEWNYTIKSYDEKKLPQDVRATVKRTYYDFSIYGAQEIHVEDKVIYMVYLEDENTLKTVRVCDDEMEETVSYKKAR